jgi:tetratricopeptide (TPR) repeat protein
VRLSHLSFSAVLLGSALAFGNIGCRPGAPVAPTYEGAKGAPVEDKDFPLASAHYVFSRAGTPGRTDLAKPLADRLLIRARALIAAGRERPALASIRLAAALVRANKVAPETLSEPAVSVFDPAVQGPAARGEEGSAIGVYLFWSVARPADARPKQHLDALAKWTGSPADSPPSALVSIGREAVRRSEALAFAPNDSDRPNADKALLEWMDQVVAFKDGERTPARYGDEVYAAVLGYRTSGVRLVVNHLRDGDIAGAVDAISAPQTQGFVPDPLRRALLDAGSAPSLEGYEEILAALLPTAKLEGLDDAVSDAVLGTALAGNGDFPHSEILAEVTARGLLLAGSGDAAPAILAQGLLGTNDDPRRPPAKDLGRALSIASAALRDYADREEFDAARRTYVATLPLITAADQVGSVTPSSGLVKALMGVIEGEAGKPAAAKKLFDEAITGEQLPIAYAGRARLLARDGDLAGARAAVQSALDSKQLEGESALNADLLILGGDYARRAGDATAARGFYERALRLLVPLRVQAKGAASAEIGARIVAILAHVEGMAEKEDEAAARAESGAGDSRAVQRLAMLRFLRPLRMVDAKRARAAYRRAGELGLPVEEQVMAAIIARAVGKRANLADDADVTKTLTSAAAKDDAAGRLAKFALGQLDAAALVAKAGTPQRAVHAKLAIAMVHWGDGGLPAAKADLEAVAKSDVVPSIASDLALELLDPSKGAVPGVIAAKAVPGL